MRYHVIVRSRALPRRLLPAQPNAPAAPARIMQGLGLALLAGKDRRLFRAAQRQRSIPTAMAPTVSAASPGPAVGLLLRLSDGLSDQGMNSDLKPSEEIRAAEVQFARSAGVCRTFAPIYRQMTLGAVAASRPERTLAQLRARLSRHRLLVAELPRHQERRPALRPDQMHSQAA
jgi:hypothetical protein